MRLLLIAFALVPAASMAAPEHPPAAGEPLTVTQFAPPIAISPYPEACPSETARIAEAAKAPPEFHRLTDLPDANAYSAVFRRTDGCPDPIVISYGAGDRR